MKKRAKASAKSGATQKLDLKKPVKVPSSRSVRSKSEVHSIIADKVGVSRRDVAGVLHVMASLIKTDLAKGGPGVFKVPGLMRVTVQRKPATKARPGTNPFTGESIMIKAKPARNVVKVRPLRGLKELV